VRRDGGEQTIRRKSVTHSRVVKKTGRPGVDSPATKPQVTIADRQVADWPGGRGRPGGKRPGRQQADRQSARLPKTIDQSQNSGAR